MISHCECSQECRAGIYGSGLVRSKPVNICRIAETYTPHASRGPVDQHGAIIIDICTNGFDIENPAAPIAERRVALDVDVFRAAQQALHGAECRERCRVLGGASREKTTVLA
jgi:hypothetical protein